MAGIFDDEPFTVEFRDGNAILKWPDGTARVQPRRVFDQGHQSVLDAYRKENANRVVPIEARLRPTPKRNAVFATMLPIITISDGHAFLTVDEEGYSVCATMHNFELFLEDARRKVVAWHAQLAPIIPMRKRPKD